MNRFTGFLRLMRPVNCLMMGFAVIVGTSLVWANSASAETFLKLLFGFVTGFTLTAASMAVNDYYDREIDIINEPNRPIPSGTVKPKESLAFAAVLTALGFIAAFFTNLLCLAVAVISWIVSVTYVTRGKSTGLPGNFLVSACVAIPLIYGSIVISQNIASNALIFALLAFLSNTGREVTKGIVDIEGDKTKKIQTMAIKYGAKTAAYLAAAFYFLAILLSLLPMVIGIVSIWYIPFVAVADLGFATSSIMLIQKSTRKNAERIKNLALAWMLIGLIAFIAGTIR